MNEPRPLSIPVILGTPRQGRLSEHVAHVIVTALGQRDGVQTTLIDVRHLPLSAMDAGEQIKDPTFSEQVMRADGLVIVAPEYNHGYPGILKHALDTNLKEYIHKPVGLCGVSAGGFGGTRVIEGLLPVMRELGLVTIFWDLNVSSVGKTFDDQGQLLDQALPRRLGKMLDELIWMAHVLRGGRDGTAINAPAAAAPLPCPACGAAMNQHATKVDYASGQAQPELVDPAFGGVLQGVHQCPACGTIELQRTTERTP